jgi:hypothetical protein
MTATVTRKIYFYRIVIEDQPGVLLDVRDVLLRLQAIQADQRDMDLRDGRAICAWAEDVTAGKLLLGTARSHGLPEVEDTGNRAPLPLAPQQRLLETTHVMLFRDGIAGAEFNFYGPRIFKLRDYLADKFPDLPPIRLDPLTDRRVTEKLRDLETITMVKMRIHRDYLDLLQQSQRSLAEALDALQVMSNAPVIEISWKQEDYRRDSLGQRARDFVNSLVGPAMVREVADQLQVRGRDARIGRTKTFDFLRDQFVYAAKVILQDDRSRAVNSFAMFQAIESAYNTMRDDLLHAAGIEL